MVEILSSAVTLLSSVVISSYIENYAELFCLHSFCKVTLPTTVVINSAILETGNITRL